MNEWMRESQDSGFIPFSLLFRIVLHTSNDEELIAILYKVDHPLFEQLQWLEFAFYHKTRAFLLWFQPINLSWLSSWVLQIMSALFVTDPQRCGSDHIESVFSKLSALGPSATGSPPHLVLSLLMHYGSPLFLSQSWAQHSRSVGWTYPVMNVFF